MGRIATLSFLLSWSHACSLGDQRKEAMKTTSHATPATRKRPTLKSKTKTKRTVSVSIFSEIKKDHELFRKSMKQIEKAYPRDAEKAKELYSEFKVKLHAHAKAEEESLYGYLLGKTTVGAKLDNEVREGKEEHHVADFLVNELTQIPAADPKWKAKFKVLTESVEHHLDEEEEYFSLWRKKLTPAENQLVLTHFVSRRAILEKECAVKPAEVSQH
jgi:hemerythrin superfamily protein